MKIGIVGLPNVGKSTLFNALTNSYNADAANFPFCTIEPNIGIVDVNDPRIDVLSEISHSQKKIPATIKFVDIAGLVKGASKGEGMGNKFLSNIRETDAIVQVLRHFEDQDIGHVEGSVDAVRDAKTITLELILSDLEQVEKKLTSIAGKVKGKDKQALKEDEVLRQAKNFLEEEKILYDLLPSLSHEQQTIIKQFHFLTAKPFIYAINVADADLSDTVTIHKKYADALHGKPVVIVSAKFESEMVGLSDEEKQEFLHDTLEGADIPQDILPTLDTLIRTAFDTVRLMYYFTTGVKETRAWTILKGSTAPQAARVIHTDFERGFIKAEVVSYDDLVVAGSWSKAKEAGKLRLEGKQYVVQDGDVMVFKFNT